MQKWNFATLVKRSILPLFTQLKIPKISEIKTALQRGFNQVRVKFNNVSHFTTYNIVIFLIITINGNDKKDFTDISDQDDTADNSTENNLIIMSISVNECSRSEAENMINSGRSHLPGFIRILSLLVH